jgi:hypothetical protein
MLDTDVRDGVYDPDVIELAKGWADAMEAKIASGARLGAIAHSTAVEVDPTIINDSGPLIKAIDLLTKHWVHGRQLHQWQMVIMEHYGNPLMVKLVCWWRRI